MLDQPSPPPLAARGVLLRPVVGSDYGFLYKLATDEQVGFRWRFNGYIPSQEQFNQALWRDVLVQLLITRRETGLPVGLCVAYSADFSSSHVHYGVAVMPEGQAGYGAIASVLFLNYLFTTWAFNKIYVELPSFNLPQLESMLKRCGQLEGRYPQHQWYDGVLWDKLVYAIYRADGVPVVKGLLTKFRRSTERDAAR